jgi:hypothetical protein
MRVAVPMSPPGRHRPGEVIVQQRRSLGPGPGSVRRGRTSRPVRTTGSGTPRLTRSTSWSNTGRRTARPVGTATASSGAGLRGRTHLRLETGTLQPDAIAFYERHGYRRIENYGPYVGEPLSVCYERPLAGRAAVAGG